MTNRERVAALMLAAMIFGCGRTTGPPKTAEPLRVAAASDLQSAMPRLIEKFKETGGADVVATFGASGQFAQQIRQGAPIDVFLAANRKFVADLAGQGRIRPDTVRDYARGSLVLAVHESSAGRIKTLDDLKNPAIRHIAIANPDLAPYGAAARQALNRAKLWINLEPKIVRSESVVQALQFVRTGNAEAGLVGKAIARVKGVRTIEIDPSLYDPLIQTLGVVASTKQGREAEDFVRFVLSADGQAILKECGFNPTESGKSP